ncbi:MAG: hypothetical protein ACM35H_03960, partial [Bacteroidota bacterium]|nr:hypothetical protein [Kiloniellaceae bacterium]
MSGWRARRTLDSDSVEAPQPTPVRRWPALRRRSRGGADVQPQQDASSGVDGAATPRTTISGEY